MRSITLRPEAHRRLLFGHPWVYSNEIVMDAAAKALPPRRVDAAIDAGFLAARLERARALRDRLYDRPFYRLIHAEADGFPGTVVDRYGGLLVAQVNAAGMELLLPALLEAFDRVLQPEAVLLRCDSPARNLEGLPAYVKL